MDCRSHGISNPCHGPEGVGPGPQVGNGPQELKRMPLFLKGINFRIGPTHHLNRVGFQFHLLALSRRSSQGTVGNNGTTGLQFEDLTLIVGQVPVRNDLQAGKGGAVIYFDE